jgi:hypothetical protein
VVPVVASNQKATLGQTPAAGLTNATITTTGLQLTPAQKKKLAGPRLSNSFPYDARLFPAFDEDNTVFEYGEIDLQAMRQMLSEDGNPRKLEQVLSLPIRAAEWEIRGKGKIADFVRANLGDKMDQIVAQCTSAISYRKAFFELIWKFESDPVSGNTNGTGDGTASNRVIYDSIELRPAQSCETAYDPLTGELKGFRQRLNPITFVGERTEPGGSAQPFQDGWARVYGTRSFVYVHGRYREPIHGVSDLDVSLKMWDIIRKLRFLWCQYMEQQSLPKVIVFGDDEGQAQANAEAIADAGASAAIPMAYRVDPQQEIFKVLESSGKGADQFEQIVNYFEGKQTQSVLASFMDLAEKASRQSAGSNALSADQSEFYLASRQAVANEIAEQITEGIITPLVLYNFGPDAEVPDVQFSPIGNRRTDRALTLLTSIVTAEKPTVPEEFIGFLLNQVSAALGLDVTDVADVVDAWAAKRQEQMDAAEAAAAAAAEQPTPMTPPSVQAPLPGAAQLAGAPAAPPSNAKAITTPPPTGTANGKNAAPVPVKQSKLRQPRQARGPRKP